MPEITPVCDHQPSGMKIIGSRHRVLRTLHHVIRDSRKTAPAVCTRAEIKFNACPLQPFRPSAYRVFLLISPVENDYVFRKLRCGILLFAQDISPHHHVMATGLNLFTELFYIVQINAYNTLFFGFVFIFSIPQVKGLIQIRMKHSGMKTWQQIIQHLFDQLQRFRVCGVHCCRGKRGSLYLKPTRIFRQMSEGLCLQPGIHMHQAVLIGNQFYKPLCAVGIQFPDLCRCQVILCPLFPHLRKGWISKRKALHIELKLVYLKTGQQVDHCFQTLHFRYFPPGNVYHHGPVPEAGEVFYTAAGYFPFRKKYKLVQRHHSIKCPCWGTPGYLNPLLRDFQDILLFLQFLFFRKLYRILSTCYFRPDHSQRRFQSTGHTLLRHCRLFYKISGPLQVNLRLWNKTWFLHLFFSFIRKFNIMVFFLTLHSAHSDSLGKIFLQERI